MNSSPKDNARQHPEENAAKKDGTDQENQEVLDEFAAFGSHEFLRIKGGCTRVSLPVDDFLP